MREARAVRFALIAYLTLACSCATVTPSGTELDAESVEPPVGFSDLDGGSEYVREVAFDAPVAHWRLGSGDESSAIPGALSEESDGATRFDGEDYRILHRAGDTPIDAFTAEMWVAQPDGTLLSYATESHAPALALGYDGEFTVALMEQSLRTGVALEEEGWTHVALSWSGETGQLTMHVDGRFAWSSTVDASSFLPPKGTLLAGQEQACRAGCLRRGFQGGLDEVVWYEHVVPRSRLLSHVFVGRGLRRATPGAGGESIRLAVQSAHTSPIEYIEVSHDGRFFASVAIGGSVKVWHLETGRLIGTRKFENIGVSHVSFSDDDRSLAVSDGKHTVLWDLGFDEVTAEFDGAKIADVTSDHTRAVVLREKAVEVWDVFEAKKLETVDHSFSGIFGANLVLGGEAVLVRGCGEIVDFSCAQVEYGVYDLASGDQIASIELASAPQMYVVSPGGLYLALTDCVTAADGFTCASVPGGVWSLTTGEKVVDSPLKSNRAVMFGADGERVAFLGEETRMVALDVKNGNIIADANVEIGRLTSADFVDPERVLLAANFGEGPDGPSAVVWDMSRGQASFEIPGVANETAAAVSPGGAHAIIGDRDGALEIWSLERKAALHRLELVPDTFTQVAVSPQGGELILNGAEQRRWNLDSLEMTSFEGSRYIALGEQYYLREEILVSNVAEWKLEKNDVRFLVYRVGESEPVAAFAYANHESAPELYGRFIQEISFSAEEEVLVASTLDGVYAWKPDGHVVFRARPDGAIQKMLVDYKHRRVAVETMLEGESGPYRAVELWDLDSGDVVRRLRPPGDDASANEGSVMLASITASGHVVTRSTDVVSIWDIDGSLRTTREFEGSVFDVSSDGELAWVGGYEQTDMGRVARVYRVRTGELVAELGELPTSHPMFGKAVARSEDGKKLATARGGSLFVWDLEAGRLQRLVTPGGIGDWTLDLGATGPAKLGAFDATGERFFLASPTGVVRVYNLGAGTHLDLVSSGEDWVAFEPGGTFASSPNGGRIVHALQGTGVIGIDQLAVRFNRPDQILERFGWGTDAYRAHLRAQHERRLRKAGLDENSASSDVRLPTAAIVAIDGPDPTEHTATITAQISAPEGLRRFQVFVNDVPLFADGGKPVEGARKRIQTEIELTNGTNKIEVSAIGRRGFESIRALASVSHSRDEKGDLYFLGFGVSTYQDDAIPDLDYAHQDVLDLERVFTAVSGAYSEVHTRSFVDDAVTVGAIEDAKAFLASTRPHDTVVLFVAGHGLHAGDVERQYYFLTHDADLDDLEGTAANFELIEDLLDGIGARNKLFLLDTCQSGEVTNTSVGRKTLEAVSARGLKARVVQRGITVTNTVGEPPSFHRDESRFLYRDVQRRTGAIVFSSSRGSEASLEDEAFQNGAFTEAIIQGLAARDADADKDASVSTDELRAYVQNRVPELTGDLQHPTIDRDNIYQTFAFPVGLEAACSLDVADACAELANQYAFAPVTQTGAGPDVPRATKLFLKACKLGHAPSCNESCFRLWQGTGTSADRPRAVQMCERACRGGEKLACGVAMQAYAEGSVVEASAEKAETYMRLGCENELPQACFVLGELYLRDEPFGRDETLARQHLVKACELGFAQACERMRQLDEQSGADRQAEE